LVPPSLPVEAVPIFIFENMIAVIRKILNLVLKISKLFLISKSCSQSQHFFRTFVNFMKNEAGAAAIS
jgi:hypothetical protein